MLRWKARKTGAFPEQENCNGVMVMSQRTGGKECLDRHTCIPGLTPTRHRSVGRQDARSHVWWGCLDGANLVAVNNDLSRQQEGGGACMHGLGNEHKQHINLVLNDGGEVGDGREDARGGCPLANALGNRAHHLLRPVDVRL